MTDLPAISSKIIGSGSFLPKNIVSNNDLVEHLRNIGITTSSDWIFERTGILQRHIASEKDSTLSLSIEASKLAIEDAGIDPKHIDLIIVATTTPDCLFPSTACLLQEHLSIKNQIAFDIQAACSGFIYAITVADLFIKLKKIKYALVIGAETITRIVDWNDRSTCVLFGDGAGALVLGANYDNFHGILSTDLGSDGQFNKILFSSGTIRNGKIHGDPFLRMDGKTVFKKAINFLESSAIKVCKRANVISSDINWFIPHQANTRILYLLAKKLKISQEKLILTVHKHANTSSASIPLALDYARKKAYINPGNLILLQGIGGGITWGSVLLRV